MLEEALKWVGPYPLIQLMGSIALIFFGIKSAMAGAKSAPPPAPPQEVELPQWFIDEHKEMTRNVQRTLWMVEAIWNKIEMGRGSPPPPALPPG